ncbi:uncharacterized protein BJ212DRAFT_441819 [Suillus subaureus]|uniref:Uncharacterized protein n=1 Tax=Suillus subaureus TaxID=48587 RepID=A0A9P7JBM4_9AGAM|nr:uncharacterized protein BJ212DRAFT_441819 [Suillus subaureus]KAG1812952.1 hypothetical protein BJ212DRAFT_441819 [Suillus subaureus]
MVTLTVSITGLVFRRHPAFSSLCGLSLDQFFDDVLHALFLLFALHTASIPIITIFRHILPCASFPIQPHSSSPDLTVLLSIAPHILFCISFPRQPQTNKYSFSPIPPHTHPSSLFLIFILHATLVPISTVFRRRSPYVFPSIPIPFPIPLQPIISLLTQRRFPTFSTCPSSPFLPHTVLTLNSAPNLHFADRRRCHDDTNTHYPLVGACMYI